MVEMEVHEVNFDLNTNTAIVILVNRSENTAILIGIGILEARAILMGLNNITNKLKRPMTHDTMVNIINKTGMEIESININKIEDNTFFSLIKLNNGSEKMEIDSRPSDAIALAVRSKVPLFVSEEVYLKTAISLVIHDEEFDSEENTEDFKKFINNISPNDFINYGKENLSMKDKDKNDDN